MSSPSEQALKLEKSDRAIERIRKIIMNGELDKETVDAYLEMRRHVDPQVVNLVDIEMAQHLPDQLYIYVMERIVQDELDQDGR